MIASMRVFMKLLLAGLLVSGIMKIKKQHMFIKRTL